MAEPAVNNATTAPTKTVQVAPVDLLDFPLQAATFGPVTDAENERLQASMQADGQRDPVHVLPPGNKAGLPAYSLLDGHRRRDAAVAMGWSVIQVVVRHDLADADLNRVSQAFLEFNSNRRQLDPLDRAIVLVRRHEIETGRSADRWTGGDLNVVTAQLEPFLEGRGNKTARRNTKVACLPDPIIQAYRSGRLRVTAAEKVFSLKPHYREQIADAVAEATRNNPDDKVNDLVLDAVHELVPQREPSEDKLTKYLDNIRKAAESFIADYDERLDRITHPSWAENHLDNVVMVHDFLGRLRNQLAEVRHNPAPLIERINPFDERNQDD